MSDLKIFTDNIEPEATNQIYDLIKQDAFKDAKVRIMPDVHAGKGCVVGFTADLGDKVIPNIVGVDIGCGMLCVRLGGVDLDLEIMDKIINKNIPSGKNVHNRKSNYIWNVFDWKKIYCLNDIKNIERIDSSLGTLGGGNHFIEINEDSDGFKYLVIHSGSRNLGKQVAELYQKIAIETCEDKVPKELKYLTGELRERYLHDMKLCQQYASENRMSMANIILREYFHKGIGEFSYFETIHNYIDFESNIVRKGSISAKEGELVLIPINMRDGSIVAIGKGNDDWNKSAPHGAGRLMSRSKAKEFVNLDEYKDSMKGIYTSSVNQSTLDEAPMVYKPMQEIIDNIGDTVEIIDIIKPIYNFKAGE